MIARTLQVFAQDQAWMIASSCIGMSLFLGFFVTLLFWVFSKEQVALQGPGGKLSQIPFSDRPENL